MEEFNGVKFLILFVALAVGAIYLLPRLLRRQGKTQPTEKRQPVKSGALEMYCTSCGNVGPPTRSLRGNSFITFLLIWFMIIPAIVYSFWRHSGPNDRCATCGKATMIPLTSPIAQKALKT